MGRAFRERTKFLVAGHFFWINPRRGRQNIVGIFQENPFCIFDAAFFRACHRMSADEPVIQTVESGFFMNAAFCAAHIGENGRIFQVGL